MDTLQPLYFIGWDYHSPHSTPLKRLLSHPHSPWNKIAIVHEQTWVESVDGISLICSQDFIELCGRQPGVQAVIMTKDATHHKRWLRLAKAHQIILFDEGEIFQVSSTHLKTTNKSADLGVVTLPQPFSIQSAKDLRKYCEMLDDQVSRDTLQAYAHFIETGLLDKLRAVARTEAENPVSSPDTWMASLPWERSVASALAWEAAPQRTSFLEQALLLSSAAPASWSYAFSASTTHSAMREGQRLSTLMQPFGIRPIVSTLSSNTGITPHHTFDVPIYDQQLVIARLDVVDPLLLLAHVIRNGYEAHLHIRLGRRPEQLIQFLNEFWHLHPILRCDRPGPLGLFANLTLGKQ